MSRCLINFGHLVRTRSIDFALGPAEEVNMSPGGVHVWVDLEISGWNVSFSTCSRTFQRKIWSGPQRSGIPWTPKCVLWVSMTFLVHTNHSAHDVVNCLIGRRDGKRLQVQGRTSRAQTSRSICFPLSRWSLRLLTRLALRDAFEPRSDLLGGATDGPCRRCTSRQSGSHPLGREFQGIQDP